MQLLCIYYLKISVPFTMIKYVSPHPCETYVEKSSRSIGPEKALFCDLLVKTLTWEEKTFHYVFFVQRLFDVADRNNPGSRDWNPELLPRWVQTSSLQSSSLYFPLSHFLSHPMNLAFLSLQWQNFCGRGEECLSFHPSVDNLTWYLGHSLER